MASGVAVLEGCHHAEVSPSIRAASSVLFARAVIDLGDVAAHPDMSSAAVSTALAAVGVTAGAGLTDEGMACAIATIGSAVATVSFTGLAVRVGVAGVALLRLVALSVATDDRADTAILRTELALLSVIAGAVSTERDTFTAIIGTA